MPPLSRSIPVLRLHQRRLFSSLAAFAVRQDPTTWTQTPLTRIEPASADASMFHVSIDVSESPDLAGSFTAAGQYVQLRIPSSAKSSFLAIASPPEVACSKGEFEFLVKKIAGSTAEALCGLNRGDVVEIGGVMGRGFELERVGGDETLLIFSTGSGISPIRSLIESGLNANKRSDVRLYYGARNLQRMAYQDRFEDWEATGVRLVPVLSQPDDLWKGERGYIQAVFSKAKQISDPSSTGAVLCGHKQMTKAYICGNRTEPGTVILRARGVIGRLYLLSQPEILIVSSLLESGQTLMKEKNVHDLDEKLQVWLYLGARVVRG